MNVAMTMPATLGQPDADQIKQAKLADSAQQFEGTLIQEMFKGLHFGTAPGDDDSTGGANDTLRGMSTESFAKSIAKAGGFGLAKQVIRQVSAQQQVSETKQHSTKV